MMLESTIDDAVHPVKDVNLAVALVQPEGAFVNVSLEMLLGKLMIGSIEHPFSHSPDALDAIRACHSIDEFLGTMVHLDVLPLRRHSIVY